MHGKKVLTEEEHKAQRGNAISDGLESAGWNRKPKSAPSALNNHPRIKDTTRESGKIRPAIVNRKAVEQVVKNQDSPREKVTGIVEPDTNLNCSPRKQSKGQSY